ncbi:serine/threonine-protein kinase [Nocardioides halotolerans]|uniref:serine/threonine-protein kinase n=1 Tax=Nocardioides halotolerans TaxID=433660 RepID=UPI00056C7F93|nr:serine/threonine-protein kinase [Nocardioides halotolerans]
MPHRLGRYAVRRRIGSGGFATVWLAYDEQLDSPVAIKVLADNWTEDHQIRQRFLEEGRYLRKVESPHVVSVYDAGELDDGRPYLVMSYADQGTLADRLDVELTPAQALEVIRQVGAGLQALHDRDILHRDVKPANVLFRSIDGAEERGVRAMLGDLGLGKSLDMSSRLTMVAGTPTYVAPEQAAAQAPDARADQYSLAALSFLLLTGRAPFTHLSLSDAMNPGALPPVSTPERPFPSAVEAVLRRGLAHDRDDRYPSVTAFVDALADALGPAAAGPTAQTWLARDPELTQAGPRPTPQPEEGGLPEPALPRRRGRRLGVLTLVGLVALVVGGGAGYAAQRQLAPTDRTVSDATGTLSVTVPADWDRADARDGWTPPGTDTSLPALSVGTSEDWAAQDSDDEGVFLGLLSSTELPEAVPQHPECDTAGRTIDDARDGDTSKTVVYADCTGGTVVVERVVQVSTNTLLWVQIRSSDRATANQVLDDVRTHGL